MLRLIPREEKFFVIYRELGKNIVAAALTLKDLMEDFSQLEKKRKIIKDLEHTCDILTHRIIKKLNRSFITPFDREDIFALAFSLDDIIDVIDASAQHLAIYHIYQITPEAKQLGFIVWQACILIAKAIEVLESDHKAINGLCVEINSYENEADRVRAEAISRLFVLEKNPIELIKWKEIYENLELITDKCEDAANILEGIVVKNA